jgi:hypothetical protein
MLPRHKSPHSISRRLITRAKNSPPRPVSARFTSPIIAINWQVPSATRRTVPTTAWACRRIARALRIRHAAIFLSIFPRTKNITPTTDCLPPTAGHLHGVAAASRIASVHRVPRHSLHQASARRLQQHLRVQNMKPHQPSKPTAHVASSCLSIEIRGDRGSKMQHCAADIVRRDTKP